MTPSEPGYDSPFESGAQEYPDDPAKAAAVEQERNLRVADETMTVEPSAVVVAPSLKTNATVICARGFI